MLPPTSCFGEEENGRWPFKPYIQMLASNNISAGRVVTRMSFDGDSDVPVLKFRAVGYVNREQYDAAIEGGNSPEAQRMLSSTVAQTDNVKALPKALPKAEAKPAAKPAAKPVVEEIEEPVKRPSKKAEAEPEKKRDLTAVLDAWGDDN